MKQIADQHEETKLTEAELEQIVIEGGSLIGGYQQHPVVSGIPIGSGEGGKMALSIFLGGYLLGSGKVKRDKISFAEVLAKRKTEEPNAANEPARL